MSRVTVSTEPREKHSQPGPFRDEPDGLGRRSDFVRETQELSPGMSPAWSSTAPRRGDLRGNSAWALGVDPRMQPARFAKPVGP